MAKSKSTERIFTGILGINNRITPKSLDITRSDLVEVASAVNVDIDNAYSPSRRTGHTRRVSGNFHSLHKNSLFGYGVKDDHLVVFGKEMAPINLLAVSDNKMHFANVGKDVYFANGQVNGVINGTTLRPWDVGITRAGETRHFEKPPTGSVLEYYHGRMYMSVEGVLYASEPYAPTLWDLSATFMDLGSHIRFVRGTGDTLYVSTDNTIFALRGTSPSEFKQELVAEGIIVAGTDVQVKGFLEYGNGMLATTTKGICFFGEDGRVVNLTEEKLVLPRTVSGGAFMIKDNYICSSK
ncbi:MAG: hypothetical protein KAH23_01695 [Kiritimatiellae bacterium]|nr:hypothetical protein [Kiritimatiellia bacterium]